MKKYIKKLLFKELKEKLALQTFYKGKYDQTKLKVWYQKLTNTSNEIKNIENYIEKLEKINLYR